MKTLSRAGFFVLITVLSSGCRCGYLNDASGDFIDTITEPRLSLDRWYRPELDLTRIGKPDWCRSPFNRLLCRDKCSGSCGNSCRSQCGCPAESGCGDCGCNQVSHTEGDQGDEHEAKQILSTENQNSESTPQSLFEEIPPPQEDDQELLTP